MTTQPSHSSSPDENGDYDFTEQVGHLLRRAYQRHVSIFQQTIPDSQLTAGQFVVLCAIQEQGPCSLSAIARATAIDQATVRGIIERLKSRELIVVSHDARDRRKVVVLLSPAGRTLIGEVVPFAQDISERTMGGLNPAERVALLYLLRKMSDLEDASPEPLSDADGTA
ncbi:MarR family winged helix-turn-helix transcriptional regulator [Cupriavidus plantarum]|uniref:MarR family winged helix-turn-helix transcriptional regulator n=1 Tax=Cupriavidus plantarum TaxID=942865 RepID=UPI000E22227A|nr:MarR family winged helix-turn-helix transcriptional regulator [Cupriavidus plantarum]REE90983.1 MarR family transcriptional regulator [Cupriavidus plantarum]